MVLVNIITQLGLDFINLIYTKYPGAMSIELQHKQ